MIPRGGVWVIAHRGASEDRPENTLAAFDEALRQGSHALELDLQLSRDGVPVVHHDRTLIKVGGGRRRVSALELAALRRLAPGRRLDRKFQGQHIHIPSLDEVLRRYGHRTRLLLELKTFRRAAAGEEPLALIRAVVHRIRRLKVEANVFILSFHEAVLEAFAEEAPELRRVLNLKPPARLDRSLGRRLASLAAVSADVRTLTGSFGAAVRERGLSLFAFTCNSARSVDRALAAGATGIISDRPEWLAGQLAAADRRRAT